METPQFEIKTEENSPEVFFSRVQEDLKIEEEKLTQMDGDKVVPKEDYRNIQEQAKRVAFLRQMEKVATLYSEASGNGNTELLGTMKKYLNI